MEENNSKRDIKRQADGSKRGSETSSSNEREDANPSNKSDEVILNSIKKSEDHHNTVRCQKVFKTYYARLCDCIPVEEVLPHLVSNDVITVREMEDIRVEKTSLRQAQALLNGPIWRAIRVCYPKPFITFLYVLHSIHGCKMLCEEMCTDLCISTEILSSESRKLTARPCYSQSTTGMSKYRQQLKSKYKKLSLSSPEELLECKSSRYVNLVLTKFDKKLKREREELVSGQLNDIMMNSSRLSSADTPLTLADVLNVKEEENKVILIEGGPGMGKSTLAIKICKCWADGNLLEKYDAVILLSLRDPEIQAAKSIKDLLLVLDDELRECVYKEITKTNGEGICFLLEGFDELPHRLKKYSIFSTLSEKLTKCTLMYTSRPEACNHLRSIASCRIEIRGVVLSISCLNQRFVKIQ